MRVMASVASVAPATAKPTASSDSSEATTPVLPILDGATSQGTPHRAVVPCHAPTAPDHVAVVHLTITRRALRRLWWLILVIQLLNGCHLVILSYLYVAYAWSADSLLPFLASRFLSSPQQAFLRTYSVYIGSVYGVVGALFVWASLAMISSSLGKKTLSFGQPDGRGPSSRLKPSDIPATTRPPRVTMATTTVRTLRACLHHVERCGLGQLRRTVVRGWVACGVRGSYFDQAMLVRETIELFYQTVQADQVSRRISHRAVNYAYTALIAANALLHPTVARLFRHNPPLRRFAVVFCDFFLDFVWGSVLPAWMLWPYIQMDRNRSGVEQLMMDGFGSIENAQREVEQLVVLSWSALLLSVLPFSSALLSLRSVKKLLTSAKCIESWSDVTPEERLASLRFSFVPSAFPLPRRQTNTNTSTSARAEEHERDSNRRAWTRSVPPLPPLPPQSHHVPVRSSTVVSYAHHLVSLGGLIVACIAMASSGVFVTDSDDAFRVWTTACKFPLTPWFATTPACAAWFLNCTQMGLTGSAPDMEAALALVHAESLVFLGLQSCPQLEMNVALLRFRNLRALSVWDSQLERWGLDVTLSHEHFPVLQTVLFENVVFSDEPRNVRGFLRGPWSDTLEQVIVVDSDLTALRLSDNGTAWMRLRSWYCVRCGLTTFPRVLFRSTQLHDLVIEGTAITTVPSSDPDADTATDTLATNRATPWPQLEQLSLSGNAALTSLADDVWTLFATGSLQQLDIGGTNVSSIPSHVVPQLPQQPVIRASGTPFCRDTDAAVAIPSLVCVAS